MTKNNNSKYKELAKVKISESRNLVISGYVNGGFTIAQQLEADENGKKTYVFMKDAFHLDDVHTLYELRDAINLAIKVTEDTAKENANWD